VENIFQRIEQGGDGEMVIFFCEGDTRAVDDRKRIKTVLGDPIKYFFLDTSEDGCALITPAAAAKTP
jgi:hypothetical protein